MRGTIHLAAARGRALAARAVRAASRGRRGAPLRAARPDGGRGRPLRRAAADAELAGDRRLSRPDVMRAVRGSRASRRRASAGTTSSCAWPSDALICIGPMQGRQPTFVLLDEWAPLRAPRASSSGSRALALLAARFVVEPRAGHRSGPRALGGHHARRRAAGAARRAARRSRPALAGRRRVLGRGRSGRRAPRRAPGARGRTCSRASTSTSSATRIATPQLAARARRQGRPGRERDLQARASWSTGRSSAPGRGHCARRASLTVTLQPFAAVAEPRGVGTGRGARYRDFLGLPASCEPVVAVEDRRSA